MPTYEYECRACGHSFEKTQSMSDDPVKDCPECGKDVRRLIFGGAGIIFKGSGFYVNDSKGKSPTISNTSKTNSPPGDSSTANVPAGVASESAPGKKSSGDSAAPGSATPAFSGTKTESRPEARSEARSGAKESA